MKEHDLYPEIIKTAKLYSTILFRVQDTTQRAPFDLTGIINNKHPNPEHHGRAIAIEVKVNRRTSSHHLETIPSAIPFFPNSNNTKKQLDKIAGTPLDNHQYEWLGYYAKSNAISLIIIRNEHSNLSNTAPYVFVYFTNKETIEIFTGTLNECFSRLNNFSPNPKQPEHT